MNEKYYKIKVIHKDKVEFFEEVDYRWYLLGEEKMATKHTKETAEQIKAHLEKYEEKRVELVEC